MKLGSDKGFFIQIKKIEMQNISESHSMNGENCNVRRAPVPCA